MMTLCPQRPGVVRGGFPGRAVEAAAVMEIKHKINFGPGDDALQTAHRGVFGIVFPQGGELAVHVAVESARPLDDAGEIEIGNHQHGAPVITVMGGQQRSGGKTARLIALNAAHDEDGRPSPEPCAVRVKSSGEVSGGRISASLRRFAADAAEEKDSGVMSVRMTARKRIRAAADARRGGPRARHDCGHGDSG